MKKFILNIGLTKSPRYSLSNKKEIPVSTALSVLGIFGIDFDRLHVKKSETENTLIVESSTNEHFFDFESIILKIAKALMQDCIAVYFPKSDDGFLIGEYAQIWGTFDKQYFLEIGNLRKAA